MYIKYAYIYIYIKRKGGEKKIIIYILYTIEYMLRSQELAENPTCYKHQSCYTKKRLAVKKPSDYFIDLSSKKIEQ